jgi:UDP-glucose 4-epimerase
MHLINALLKSGHEVCCFDRPSAISIGDYYLMNSRFNLYEGNFTCESDLINALSGCDICFHLVSTTLPKSSNTDPVFDIDSNLVGSVKLFQLAVKAGIKKIVFVSSGGTVYGIPRYIPITEAHPTDPICSYGITKLAIEKYLRLFHELHGLDSIVLRLSNPYGEGQKTFSGQGVVATFLEKAFCGETIEIYGDGSVVRDYIYIEDVVSALLLAMEYFGEMHVFNIGSGKGYSLNELLVCIEKTISMKLKCSYLPKRAFDVPVNQLCIDQALCHLGWSPRIDLEHGMKRTAEALQGNNILTDQIFL